MLRMMQVGHISPKIGKLCHVVPDRLAQLDVVVLEERGALVYGIANLHMNSRQPSSGQWSNVGDTCRIGRDCGGGFDESDRCDTTRLVDRKAEPGLRLGGNGDLAFFRFA